MTFQASVRYLESEEMKKANNIITHTQDVNSHAAVAILPEVMSSRTTRSKSTPEEPMLNKNENQELTAKKFSQEELPKKAHIPHQLSLPNFINFVKPPEIIFVSDKFQPISINQNVKTATQNEVKRK